MEPPVVQDLLDADYIARSLEGLAGVFVTQGAALPAAHLLGAAERLHQSSSGTALQFDPIWHRKYARILATVRSQLDDHQFLAAWNEGRTMTQDAACLYARKIANTVG